MKISHEHVVHELPDSWWNSALMQGFVPGRQSFRADTGTYPGLPILELSPHEVEPLVRQLAYGMFRDQQSVASILTAFRQDIPLPPVQVVRAAQPEGKYPFSLQDGGHRFYAALAARFLRVPAVDVTCVRFSGPEIYLNGRLVGLKGESARQGRPTMR